jgi:hypothetical protein
LYEPRKDFPGRIEVLPQFEKEPEAEPEPEHVTGSPSDAQPEPEPVTGRQPEQETASESAQGDNQDATRGLGKVLGAVFGRRE